MDQSAPGERQDEKERVAGIFDRAARTFDQTGPPLFSLFGDRLAHLADIRRGQTVLDVACGRGASALAAAKLVGPRGRVVGVDLAERMVEELQRDVDELKLTNLEVMVMDAEDLRFPDAAFDRVLGGFCLFFFPRPERALAEMWRVLKPGGRLAVSTWDKRETSWRWLDDLIDSYLPASDGAPARSRREHDQTDSPARMRALLSQAGLGSIQVLEETGEFAYSGEDEWWASLWTRGKRGDLERIEGTHGAAGLARFEAEAREQLRERGLTRADGVHQRVRALYSLATKL